MPHYLVDLSLIHILFTDFFHIKSYATQKISPMISLTSPLG
ncbi:hypothetical protein VCRA2111O136_310027 [Vibrio crassostreae]|nr:hypothetical protein VCRA2111O136_310027 [Vibrio crassostreae]